MYQQSILIAVIERALYEKFFQENYLWEILVSAQGPKGGVGKASASHMVLGFFICFFTQDTEQRVWKNVPSRGHNASS